MKHLFLTRPLSALVAMSVIGSVTCSCPNNKATLLTFNAGLTPTVYGRFNQRPQAVIAAIADQRNNADFMCLQELWYEEDVKSVLDNLESDFPYHFSAIHSGVGQLRARREKRFFSSVINWLFPGRNTAPCDELKLLKLSGCYVLSCLNSADSRGCILKNCGSHLYGLSQDCRSCVSVSSSSSLEPLKKCADITKKFNRINGPGLLVLSKQPLNVTKYVNYLEGKQVLLERGFISAQVGNNPAYICTHLSASFAHYYEAKLPQFKSYEEQQAAEISKLNVKFSGVPHVLLGDLNTGPARNVSGSPVLQGELPTNYGMLTSLGYQNPYLQNDGRCTYCSSSNPVLLAANKDAGDLDIDHVLTRNVDSDITSAQRVLDSTTVLLSDHFGVQLDICLP